MNWIKGDLIGVFQLSFKHTLNNTLDCLIRKRGINTNQLHKHTGIPLSTLKRLRLNKENNPTLASLAPIANFFSVSLDQLIGKTPLLSKNEVETNSLTIPLISWKDIINSLKNRWRLAFSSVLIIDTHRSTRQGEHEVRSQGARDRRALTGEAGNASRRKVIVGATARSPEWASAWRTQDESGPTFSRVMRTNFGGTTAKIFREHSDSLDKDSYALLIENNNWNNFLAGSLLVINPSLNPHNRDFIIVYKKGRRSPELRQVLIYKNKRYLKNVNSESEIIDFSEKYQSLGVIIEIKMNYKKSNAYVNFEDEKSDGAKEY
ncbi:MAG: XRE family transcriptional regulator [Candidatus Aquirickettsiella gammari]|uniref:XRE family transcriptional regulator n=1 Tax=Candidatus Aquirickettsiella gammari TaxID=2016198 RepID=A0A370CI49_9COXI|nr:MAG: XRE family transcriptional regulator [Candidatus Aquirickettsiella gammari]